MKQANKTTDGALHSVDVDAIQAATSHPNRREGVMRVNRNSTGGVPRHVDGDMWLIGRGIMRLGMDHGRVTTSINRSRPLISYEEYRAEKERVRQRSLEELGQFFHLVLRRGWLKPSLVPRDRQRKRQCCTDV